MGKLKYLLRQAYTALGTTRVNKLKIERKQGSKEAGRPTESKMNMKRKKSIFTQISILISIFFNNFLRTYFDSSEKNLG